MANFDAVNDLLEDILRRGGELEPDDAFVASAPYTAQVLRYLNRAYWRIGSKGTWPWRRKDPPGVIRLLPAITAGTVNLTLDSTSAILSVAPAAGLGSLVGWKLVPTGGQQVYRIAAHTAGSTTLTLDSAYDEVSSPTANYNLFKDEYDLPSDCDHILAALHPRSVDPLPYRDESAFRREYPFPYAQVPPDAWTYVGQSKIQFSHYGTDGKSYRVELQYARVMTALATGGASSTILLPAHQRYVMADFALYFLLKDKDDSKADEAAGLAETGLDDLLLDVAKRATAASLHGAARYRDL